MKSHWIVGYVIKKLINNQDKVRDHCHITDTFRGATFEECNSKLRIPREIAIIFYNLDGYDEHLIFEELNSFKDIYIQVFLKQMKNIWVLLSIAIFSTIFKRFIRCYSRKYKRQWL